MRHYDMLHVAYNVLSCNIHYRAGREPLTKVGPAHEFAGILVHDCHPNPTMRTRVGARAHAWMAPRRCACTCLARPAPLSASGCACVLAVLIPGAPIISSKNRSLDASVRVFDFAAAGGGACSGLWLSGSPCVTAGTAGGNPLSLCGPNPFSGPLLSRWLGMAALPSAALPEPSTCRGIAIA
jgi:hypothetical protein